MLLATRETQAWLVTELSKSTLTEHTGTLGPSKLLGDVQEVRILSRILRYVQPPYAGADKAYLEWEPDPRHVEILVSAMGLDSGSEEEAVAASYRSNRKSRGLPPGLLGLQ